MSPRRALMLVNPNARRGSEAVAVVPRLEAGGLTVVVEHFASPGEAGLPMGLLPLGTANDLARAWVCRWTLARRRSW